LKKPAGSDNILIIVAASTDILSFVSILDEIRLLAEPSIRAPQDEQRRNIAVTTRSDTSPLPITSLNRNRFILGVSIPTKVTASVARAIST
jgi:hypothetical protein